MPVWLTIGLVVAVLLLVGGGITWWTKRSDDEKVPRLEIDVHSGSADRLRTTSVHGREMSFTITVTNAGQTATTVADIYLDVPEGWRLKMSASFEGRSLLHGDRPLPCRLEPGESVSYGVPREALTKQLREMDVRLADQPVTVQVMDVNSRIHKTELPPEQSTG